MKVFDINVASPDQLGNVLRDAAQDYRESQIELSASWGDLEAGRVWEKLAAELDKAADRCDAIVAKHFN